MRLAVLIVVAAVLFIAAVTLVSQDAYKDIDLPDTAPSGTNGGTQPPGDGGTPPGDGGTPPPPPLGRLHVLAVIFYSDGSQETVSADPTILTVFNAGTGKAISRVDYRVEYTAGRAQTVWSRANTFLTVKLVSTIGMASPFQRVVDSIGDKPMTPGQRLFILSASVYAADLSAAADGGYRLSYNLTFKVQITDVTPSPFKVFYVQYPSIDISIQTAVVPPPGGGGGGIPRQLSIVQGVDKTATVWEGSS